MKMSAKVADDCVFMMKFVCQKAMPKHTKHTTQHNSCLRNAKYTQKYAGKSIIIVRSVARGEDRGHAPNRRLSGFFKEKSWLK